MIDNSRCLYCGLCVEVCPVNCIYHTEEFEAQAYSRLELAHQFGERPVDPTIDPRPAVKKKKPAGKAQKGKPEGAPSAKKQPKKEEAA